MSDDSGKKWDLKQVGAGGGGVIALLFMFQSQGIEMMSANSATQSQVVIEKTLANSDRIRRLEDNVKNLNDKIDKGFDSLRHQIRQDTDKLSDILRMASSDRFTKTEHNSYRIMVDGQMEKLQDQINKLRDGVK